MDKVTIEKLQATHERRIDAYAEKLMRDPTIRASLTERVETKKDSKFVVRRRVVAKVERYAIA